MLHFWLNQLCHVPCHCWCRYIWHPQSKILQRPRHYPK